MPCTITRVEASRRMLKRHLLRGEVRPRSGRGGGSYRRKLDDLLCCLPRVRPGLDAVLLEDLAAFLLAGPTKSDHQRQLHLQVVASVDEALGHLVPARDPAENVHQDALHARVHEDDRERVFDHFGFRPAADVAKVRRPSARTLHEVEGAHAEPRAVADDPDLAVERYICEPALFRLDLVRVALDDATIVLFQILVPPRGVLVNFELRFARDHLTVFRHDQWVDLGGQGIELGNGAIELLDDRAERPRQLAKARVVYQLCQLEFHWSAPGIRIETRNRLGRFFGHLLDVDAALG